MPLGYRLGSTIGLDLRTVIQFSLPSLGALCRARPTLAALALLCAPALSAQDGPGASRLDGVQVTATRFADPVQEVPNSISVVSGDELRARGVYDLRGALMQLAGITVGPGGDGGSAGASLGLLGRRETDDFLLVVDGVPAGGAFMPQFATVNLHDVERIEVIRGSTPVYYGTTAFAGTVNIVHYPAGKGPGEASLTLGSYGSFDLAAAAVLSSGAVRQSLSLDGGEGAGSDQRAGFKRLHGLYRLATSVGGGEARVDLDLTRLRDRPASPTPYLGSDPQLPLDFNQNPANGRIDTLAGKLTTGYDLPLDGVVWSTLLALTHTRTDTVQGYLDSDFAEETDTNAAGYEQGRTIDDLFLDSHFNQSPTTALDITYGVNILDGELRLANRQFRYLVPFDGSRPADSATAPTLDTTRLADHRTLYGLYAQTRWKASESLNLLAGLRWNRTVEKRDNAGDEEGFFHSEARATRLSGSVGANWWVWKDSAGDLDDLSLYVNIGNTFQPPQVDVGPDAPASADLAAILKPEFLQGVELGAKADGLDGRLDLDVSAFFIRFHNRPLTTTVNNLPAVVAGGEERFRGFEVEAHWSAREDLKLSASYAHNRATYGDFLTQLDGGGDPVQLSGKRIEFVPSAVIGLGVIAAPARGWQGALTAQYQGPRPLDPENLAGIGGFTVVNLQTGYRWKDWSVQFSADNLGDRREPVLASELGAGQAYRLPGRRLFATLRVKLD